MLTSGDEQTINDALVSIVEQGDQRFISGLIELMRAGQIGLVRSVNYPALIEALESLSGQQLGYSWPACMEWYGGTDLHPPPGFTSWKWELLGHIDPQSTNFLRDEFPPAPVLDTILDERGNIWQVSENGLLEPDWEK